jgi:histidine phosphotransfer protein HptB
MGQHEEAIVDWERFAQARTTLGANFLRVIGYFSDDGAKSVSAIEDALRMRNAIAMIGPADLLKSDAMQIGALSVAEIAEDIEFGARDCVEWRQSPEILLEPVMQLRILFENSVGQFEKEVNPLLTRRAS